jgi:hypothetical protein
MNNQTIISYLSIIVFIILCIYCLSVKTHQSKDNNQENFQGSYEFPYDKPYDWPWEWYNGCVQSLDGTIKCLDKSTHPYW